MKVVFWGAVAILIYAYAGYPAWLWLRARWRPRPVKRASCQPLISIVLVVRNEQAALERKARNLLELDYPEELTEILVISDGSTDGTDVILRALAENPRVKVVLNQLSRGKAAGLNDAMEFAAGDILIFADARQTIARDAVRLLVENFADPEVGCASGELMLGDAGAGESGQGMGLYWKIEKKVREWESAGGSVVGATGALYAVRRELLAPLPGQTILDDIYLPMQALRQGKRVILDSRAKAWDSADLGGSREFLRKVRTLSGNYQLLQLAPWLLKKENPLRFEFVSHKLMRLLAPFALVALLAAAAVLPGRWFGIALWLQVGFYMLSLLGMARLRLGMLGRVADAAYTFVLLNTAAVVAFANFIFKRKVLWLAEEAKGRAKPAERMSIG